MKVWRSLGMRVAMSAGIVLVIFIVLSAFALEHAFRDSARSVRQERLLAQIYLLMAAAEVDTSGALSITGGTPEPRLDLPGSGLYARIQDRDGNEVWRSRSSLSVSPPAAARMRPGEQRFALVHGTQGESYFAQSFGVSWATNGGSFPFTFTVLEDLAPFEDQIAAYRTTLFTWLGGTALLLLVALGLTLRWGLRPLRSVADELQRLERGDQEQIRGDYPAELERLTGNLNRLVAHERARQQRYRDALADLAHSLKTPLALMRGELRDTPGSAQEMHEQIERMDRLVAYHLQRASASGRSALAVPLSIQPTVERLVAALRKVNADKPVEVDLALAPDARFRGDEGDLTEVLGNLLDNAFKWCAGRIRVHAHVEARALLLGIDDDGPGIPESAAREVLQRGGRADQSTPGHGIGLAVVRDVVQAYGGKVRIGRGELGGAAITLEFPGMG
ncbi:MAG: GHKL domain-containing protein [Burkholderiales bacterium]|nr:GHKL domain-containing protein [Burkholderiales bacterium]